MPTPNAKWPDNVPGTFYVDNQCIDCDACRTEAPEIFKRNEEKGYSFVAKQPASEDEEKHAKVAMNSCPVEAIGST